MSDEIFLEGKNYVSSKKAAVSSGYAQDYIGQLARSGLIDAQRVGGLWYVSMESLTGYQRNAAAYTPGQPPKTSQDLDAVVSFDGKQYISAAKAAKMTGYHQDYVGQLARSGKILSRQIGNRWYVEKEGLTAHKSEKDRLLAAVQTEAVGLARPEAPATRHHDAPHAPLLTYFSEDKALLPTLSSLSERHEEAHVPAAQAIPIRVVRPMPIAQKEAPIERTQPARKYVPKADNTIYRAAEAGVALTFVLVLSYGLFSLKDGSIYAAATKLHSPNTASSALAASASQAFDRLTAQIEDLIVPELVYRRAQ